MNERGAKISPSMYGVFFEEINHAGDGGLYAELIQNRSFNEKNIPDGFYVRNDTLFPKEVKNHLTGKVPVRYYKWTEEEVPAWSVQADGQTTVKMKVVQEKRMYPMW